MLHIEGDTVLDCFDETHKMRFFFPKELEFMLAKTGYALLVMHTLCYLTENRWEKIGIWPLSKKKVTMRAFSLHIK